MTAPIPTPTGPKQSFAAFLESTPPGTPKSIVDLYVHEIPLLSNYYVWAVATPDIQLYCSSDSCKGLRLFAGKKDVLSSDHQFFLTYTCKNCNKLEKTFAMLGPKYGASSEGVAYKLGENPPFGTPIPSKVISLIGPDRDLFLKGRRAENSGLGIGAFAYYRRVVENQKVRIICEIQRVAERLGAGSNVVKLFERAKNETQFARAIDDIRDAIPESLLIRGQNPLRLLHSALSAGLHAHDDDECLQIASSIRLVLTELAERISNALKDEHELEQAVNRLLQSNNPKSEAKGS